MVLTITYETPLYYHVKQGKAHICLCMRKFLSASLLSLVVIVCLKILYLKVQASTEFINTPEVDQKLNYIA